VIGTVSGLAPGQSLVLRFEILSSAYDFSDINNVSANGPLVWSGLPLASTFDLSVQTQPTSQLCSVSSYSVIATTTGTPVSIVCSFNSYNVSGTVTGLGSLSGLALQLNGANQIAVSDGAFEFPSPLADSSTYTVSIATQPRGGTCTVSHGSGTASADVTDVAVNCTPLAYSIGGTVSGLASGTSVVLQLNGGNNATVSANGSFAFSTTVAYGSAYAVSILTDPTGESCWEVNGSGIADANVSNVEVTCIKGAWTNLSADDSYYGIYGTLGVAAVGNHPGARVYAASWSDASGNFWVFGGDGHDSTPTTWAYGPGPSLNDLWEYSPSTNEWTWMGGSNTAGSSGSYGTLGVPSASNIPAARSQAVTWTDASGHFWLFGGGDMNDLWQYSAGQWTWVSGSSTAGASGSYGTQGMAAPGNVPGARDGAVAWSDTSGNLWLFGGYESGPNGGVLNDLWRYSIGLGQWTWVGGSNTPGAAGSYGTLGVPAATNAPGARENAVAWSDASGNLWLFGGAEGTGDLNDLWKYDLTLKQWTWMGGSSTPDATGSYGTPGVAAATNVPGARDSSAVTRDASGNVWVFGGRSGFNQLRDLWKYSDGQWTWISGPDVADAGTGSVSGPIGDGPHGDFGGNAWHDAAGNVFVFDGAFFSVEGPGRPSRWLEQNAMFKFTP
jgi:hypothetical protein